MWPFKTNRDTLDELLGKRCRIVFSLPHNEWPIPGYPAWGVVEAIDKPMVKIEGVWVNWSVIERITA